MMTTEQYRQAKQLINEYRPGSSLWNHEEKKTAWLKLNADIQLLGFTNVDAVFEYEVAHEVELAKYPEFGLGINTLKYELCPDDYPLYRRGDKDILFLHFAQKYSIGVQDNYTNPNIDFEYCKRVGINIESAHTTRPDTRPEAYLLHGPGELRIGGHFKSFHFKPIYLMHIIKSALEYFNIPDVAAGSNDVQVNGGKVLGCRVIDTGSSDTITLTAVFSFAFDTTIFKPAIPAVIWERVASVHTQCGITLTQEQIIEGIVFAFHSLLNVDLVK